MEYLEMQQEEGYGGLHTSERQRKEKSLEAPNEESPTKAITPTPRTHCV